MCSRRKKGGTRFVNVYLYWKYCSWSHVRIFTRRMLFTLFSGLGVDDVCVCVHVCVWGKLRDSLVWGRWPPPRNMSGTLERVTVTGLNMKGNWLTVCDQSIGGLWLCVMNPCISRKCCWLRQLNFVNLIFFTYKRFYTGANVLVGFSLTPADIL